MSLELGVDPRDTSRDPGLLNAESLDWLRLYGVRLLVGWIPPFVGGRLRTNVLRAAGIRIGKRSNFWHVPTLLGEGDVHRRLTIGTDCGFNKGSVFDLSAPVSIGNHVAVGHDVMFLTSRAGLAGSGIPRGSAPKPIVIGDGVWLGARAIVLGGVTIGPGSVIGAGVVVDRDIPENTLHTGAVPISLARWRAATAKR